VDPLLPLLVPGVPALFEEASDVSSDGSASAPNAELSFVQALSSRQCEAR